MTITLADVGSGDVKGRQRVQDEKKGLGELTPMHRLRQLEPS